MTYQEKQPIVLALSTISISFIYYFIVKNNYFQPDLSQVELFRQWALFILVLIPVQIVTTIVATILFYILNNIFDSVKKGEIVENEYEVTDELDKQVGLKSSLISSAVFTFSVFIGLATLVFKMPITTMFNVLFFGIVATGIVLEMSKLYYYRRGF